jgi:MFS family permease
MWLLLFGSAVAMIAAAAHLSRRRSDRMCRHKRRALSTSVAAAESVPVVSDPVRSKTFRALVAAYTINELGNWIGDIALAVLVFDRTGSPLATSVLFVALRFLPALIGPPLTSRVEAMPARRVLPVLHLLEGAVFATIAWVSSADFSLPVLVVLGAFDGALAVAAKALTRSATAALLASDAALRRGNAILNLGFTVGGALGPAVAGLLVAAVGPAPALLVDALTFVAAAGLLAIPRSLAVAHSDVGRWRARLRSGIRAAAGQPTVRRLLAAQAFALVFFTAVVPIEVVYVKHSLHGGDAAYGLLLASWGLGMVLGGVCYARAGHVPLADVLIVSTTLIGLGYAGLAVAQTMPAALLCSALGGLGNGAQWIAVVTAVQQSIAARAQSSVMGLLEAINQGMPAFGFLLGGLLARIGSPRTTYAVAAGGVLVVALGLAAARPPRDGARVVTIQPDVSGQARS